MLLRGALLVALAWPAFAAPPSGSSHLSTKDEPAIWIASGPEGGTYRSVYAANLETLLRGSRVFYRDTAGSADNIALMAEGKADIAFAQSDVFGKAFASGEAADIQVVGRLSDECVYIAHRIGGRVKGFGDLKAPPDGEPARIAVGPPDSGPAGSWDWMANRIPELAGNETAPAGGTLALNQLGVGSFDAVMWVTDPANLDHKMLRAAMANDRIAIMPVGDEALLAPLDDGTVVYSKRKVALGAGWRADKVETVCVSALVLMRRDADRDLIDRVSDLVSLKRDQIVPHER